MDVDAYWQMALRLAVVILRSTLEEKTLAQAEGRELAVDSEVASVYGSVVTHDNERHCEKVSKVLNVGRVSGCKILL